MPTAYEEFKTHADEIIQQIEFVNSAFRLRPRLGKVINYQHPCEELDLAKNYINHKEVRADYAFSTFHVRITAALERFCRKRIEEAAHDIVKKHKKFEELPDSISRRNIIQTGQILAQLDNPKDYIDINIGELITNLASCKKGSHDYKLNAISFSLPLVGCSPGSIEKGFQALTVTEIWDAVGKSERLESALGTDGPRETGKVVQDKLKEYWKMRNHIAHGGDEISISYERCREHIEVIQAFCEALERYVNGQKIS